MPITMSMNNGGTLNSDMDMAGARARLRLCGMGCSNPTTYQTNLTANLTAIWAPRAFRRHLSRAGRSRRATVAFGINPDLFIVGPYVLATGGAIHGFVAPPLIGN
jgi:hypothetical protein